MSKNNKRRKRGNGEGSIYRMQDGRWRAAVSLGWKTDGTGKKTLRRRIITATTRHEVAEQMTAVLNDRNRGINIDSGKQTLGQFLADWLENTVKPSTRPKTYRSYEQMVRNHLVKNMPREDWARRKLDAVEGLGAIRLAKLDLQTIQRYLNSKVTAGNSPTLVAYLRVVLRAALKLGVKAELVPRNVAALATPPKVEKRQMAPFTPEQAVRFLNAALGHRLEALFTAALAVGLRSGECSALRWTHLDLEKGIINVRYTLQRKKGEGLVLMPPKSEKSRRIIELPASCINALRAHRERQQLEKDLAGSTWIDTGHVFTSTVGTPIDDSKILKEFNALVAIAKLPKQRFHDLRHACISLLGAQGVPLKVIAEIVGHSDVRLTQNIYQHVYRDAKRDAASKMDALLSQVATRGPVATTVATRTLDQSSNSVVS